MSISGYFSSNGGLKGRNAQFIRGPIPAHVVDAVEFVCNTRNCGSFVNLSASPPRERGSLTNDCNIHQGLLAVCMGHVSRLLSHRGSTHAEDRTDKTKGQ